MFVMAETEHARSEQIDNPESIYRACADMKLFNQEVLRVILLDTRYPHIFIALRTAPAIAGCQRSQQTSQQWSERPKPTILRKSASFFQTSPHQAFFTARKRPLTTSAKVPLDTSGYVRMLVDLLLVQPVKFL
jgi:hypothetical protein